MTRADGVELAAPIAAGGPRSANGPGTPVAGVEIGGSFLAILGPGSRAFFPIELETLEVADSEESEDGVRRTLEQAIDLIGVHASQYLTWVGDVVHGIIPTLPPAGGYGSGSDSGLRGIIHASFPVSAMALAEGLVHEACHQYFHFAQLDTLFGNGQDPELYLNPYTQRDRPIDRILLAYHAFANVALLFRAFAEGGVAGAERDLAYHLKTGEGFSDALQRSRGLTPDGRALSEAIREVFA
jgi:HEXXH motif-containing protein